MKEKELFEIALKYKLKGYNIENLRYGDDLYNVTKKEKEMCLEYFWEIEENGTTWANQHLEKL